MAMKSLYQDTDFKISGIKGNWELLIEKVGEEKKIVSLLDDSSSILCKWKSILRFEGYVV